MFAAVQIHSSDRFMEAIPDLIKKAPHFRIQPHEYRHNEIRFTLEWDVTLSKKEWERLAEIIKDEWQA